MDWRIWWKKHKYYQTVILEIWDNLEAKYKQNTYSVIYIETRGSRHDWKEDDDEESESADLRRVCQGGNSLQATSNFL